MTREELIEKMAEAIDYINPAPNHFIARTALSAIEAAGITLVPNEPTLTQMKSGIERAGNGYNRDSAIVRDIYYRMLSASPFQPKEEEIELCCKEDSDAN